MSDLVYSLSPPERQGAVPARVYIGGVPYKPTEPHGPLPPLPGSVKFIVNWAAPSIARVAKNILYGFMGSAVDTSPTSLLQALANNLKAAFSSSGLVNLLSSVWNLSSVIARDNGGTSTNTAISTGSALPGGDAGDTYPPGTAVCLSWGTNITARGGRARTYLPGIPRSAANNPGDSLLSPSFANSLKTAGEGMRTAFNANTSGLTGGAEALGTLTHYQKYVILAVPIWRPFLTTHVHERIDSQRRRNGKEILFPSI